MGKSSIDVKEASMTNDYMPILGKKIPIKPTILDVAKLKFFPENPRIFSAIGAEKSKPTQENIQKKLGQMDHVKELIRDIKSNGGLIDPIIVKDGSWEVIEGNSRLAAYNVLRVNDPIKWGKIRATILPADIDDTCVFALLGQYHIKGKKDWQPYEQAGFLYRRHKHQNTKVSKLAAELGLKPAEAKNLVDTYDFMVKNDAKEPSKWSYFYEFVKSRKIKKWRTELGFENFDNKVVQSIKNDAVGTAMGFRDGIKSLGDAHPKVVKKFIDSTYDFENAVEVAVGSGNTDKVYKELKRFRMWIIKNEIKEAIKKSGNAKPKIEFETNKLYTILKNLIKNLKGNL